MFRGTGILETDHSNILFLTPNLLSLQHLVNYYICYLYLFIKIFNININWFTEWYWRCLIEDYVYRSFGIICAILSAAVVWSELTFFNEDPVLSLFALFINTIGASYDYFSIEVCYRLCFNFYQIVSDIFK